MDIMALKTSKQIKTMKFVNTHELLQEFLQKGLYIEETHKNPKEKCEKDEDKSFI